MREPGAIAKASMKLYGGRGKEPPPVRKPRTAARDVATAIRSKAPPDVRVCARSNVVTITATSPPILVDTKTGSYAAGGFCLVPMASTTQVAVIESIDARAVTVRVFKAKSGTWTKPHMMPVARLAGVPKEDDERLVAATLSIADGELARTVERERAR